MKHLGPLALFAALAVAWTWPLVLHLGDAVPGHPGDNYSYLWNLWWMRHVLATPGLAYFHTSYLFYPFGTTIADHPHTALPALVAATLLRPASIVTAQNLLLIAYVFANMAAMSRWSGTSPVSAAARYAQTAVSAPLLRLPEGEGTAYLPAGEAPCRYLVVNRAASSASLRAYVATLQADRMASDDARDLYRLR